MAKRRSEGGWMLPTGTAHFMRAAWVSHGWDRTPLALLAALDIIPYGDANTERFVPPDGGAPTTVPMPGDLDEDGRCRCGCGYTNEGRGR